MDTPTASGRKLGAYRPVHRTSDEQRHVGALLGVRERLVRSRASFVTLLQATLSREWRKVATGSSKCFGVRVEKLELPEHLRIEITPLLALLEPINARIEELDERIGEHARQDERGQRFLYRISE